MEDYQVAIGRASRAADEQRQGRTQVEPDAAAVRRGHAVHFQRLGRAVRPAPAPDRRRRLAVRGRSADHRLPVVRIVRGLDAARSSAGAAAGLPHRRLDRWRRTPGRRSRRPPAIRTRSSGRRSAPTGPGTWPAITATRDVSGTTRASSSPACSLRTSGSIPQLTRPTTPRAYPTVYWLSIAVFYDPNASTPTHPWGWTTRPHFFDSGAVQIDSDRAGRSPQRTLLAARPRQPLADSGVAHRSSIPRGTGVGPRLRIAHDPGRRGRDPDLSPVYRFWSDKLGNHFYTINEAEKDKLIRGIIPTLGHSRESPSTPIRRTAPPSAASPSTASGPTAWAIISTRSARARNRDSSDSSAQGWTSEGIAWYAFD